MNKLTTSAAALSMLVASSAVSAATYTIDFASLPAGAPVNLDIGGLMSLSGNVFVDANGIGSGFGYADFAFSDTINVTGISLGGSSNNSPVNVVSFDANGLVLSDFFTSGNWTEQTDLSSTTPIARLTVKLAESTIENFTITYDQVSAVPVPAAVWLFVSGLIGLVGISRKKTHAQLSFCHS